MIPLLKKVFCGLWRPQKLVDLLSTFWLEIEISLEKRKENPQLLHTMRKCCAQVQRCDVAEVERQNLTDFDFDQKERLSGLSHPTSLF